MKRTVDCEYIDELFQALPQTNRYVSYEADASPWGGILWAEIRKIESFTRMTDIEAGVFELYLLGLDDTEISNSLNRNQSTIHRQRTAAFLKAQRYPNLGLFTVMMEEFGRDGYRELLAERAEQAENAKRLWLARRAQNN